MVLSRIASLGFKVVVDHHRWMSLIGNLDLVVGAWGRGRESETQDLANLAGQSLCLAGSAGTGVPCEWERRDENFGVQMKTTNKGCKIICVSHKRPQFLPRQLSKSIRDWPSFSGTVPMPCRRLSCS